MKTLSGSCWLVSMLVPHLVLADVALNAPGVAVGSQSANQVPFRNTLTVHNCYKYIVSGTEARGTTTGAPGSSGTQGNGGQVLFKAFVSTSSGSTSGCGSSSNGCGGSSNLNLVQLTFRDIQTFNTSPLKTLALTPSATSFQATTTPISVDLVWQGEGNGKKPTGFFNIVGEYQSAPPIPTGSLVFPDGTWELKKSSSNPNPKGTATIIRQ